MDALDLRKEKILNLKKQRGIEGKAKIVVAMDYSGSMDSLYRKGIVQSIIEKLFPLALTFDDDGELDMYLFHDSYVKLPPVNMNNYSTYIKDNVTGHMGSTSYYPILNAIYEDNFVEKSWFGFSKKDKSVKDAVYVIFITDGDNSDKPDTTSLIKQISPKPMFIQFVGIGNNSFPYLEKLDDLKGREIDNCDFFPVKDIAGFDEDFIYDKLLQEFPLWLKEVKSRGLIS